MKHWWNDDSSRWWDYFHWYWTPLDRPAVPAAPDYGAAQEKTGMFTEKLAPVLSLYTTGANVGLHSSLHGEILDINA